LNQANEKDDYEYGMHKSERTVCVQLGNDADEGMPALANIFSRMSGGGTGRVEAIGGG
jgi:hypothetical protein